MNQFKIPAIFLKCKEDRIKLYAELHKIGYKYAFDDLNLDTERLERDSMNSWKGNNYFIVIYSPKQYSSSISNDLPSNNHYFFNSTNHIIRFLRQEKKKEHDLILDFI